MLTTSSDLPPAAVDLSNCDREPIRVPSHIQPHGLLLVIDEGEHHVVQASENASMLLVGTEESLTGKSLMEIFPHGIGKSLLTKLVKAPKNSHPLFLDSVSLTRDGVARIFNAVAHRTDAGLILELEIADKDQSFADTSSGLHRFLDEYSMHAEEAGDISALCQETAIAVRNLTEFDRVLIYRFDEDWNGLVVGEVNNGHLPAYLHHRFPASDIPAQARELYRLNRVRIIPNADYQPVPIMPPVNQTTGHPLDMSFSTLRSVSPIHVEYMKNMETASSMSVSILRNGKLWGLISCHHHEPKMVAVTVRTTCDLIARAFALRLSALEHAHLYERRITARFVYSHLLAEMAERGDFVAALAGKPADLLALTEAEGAAIVSLNQCHLIGKTPSESQTRDIADWLFSSVKTEVFHTESLVEQNPRFADLTEIASGVLAVSVSKIHPSYVIWFRPEVVRNIKWGGDPHKPVGSPDFDRLHPRKSFETWKETVRNRSLSWDQSEIEAASDLRNAIVGIVLRKAEELASLNAELIRSNKELEAFSYSVSHDLRAPLRHIVGYAEMLKESRAEKLTDEDARCINVIIESSEYAGELVDKLLGYSRLGRSELLINPIDLRTLVEEIKTDVLRDAPNRTIEWKIAKLPIVHADLMMVRMAIRDLMANAVKYTRDRDVAVIEIATREDANETVFWIADNGVGFDMQYADKLFGVFQRLHRWEDYEGTGIGLANVRRVIERHGGRTWAEGREGKGATFYFALPKTGLDDR